MKILLSLLALFCLAQNTYAQTDEYIDQAQIREAIKNGEGITTEELCNHKWQVDTSIMQLIFDNPDDNMILDMDYESIYTFYPDGTFKINATIDTDGIWEIRDNGRLLYLYNNFREDEELHHILMDNDAMKWYYYEGKSTFYQYLKTI